MSTIVTFIDAGVLILAARGKDAALRARAAQVITDPQREYASSPFVQLEVMPKAIWVKSHAEQNLYQTFFNRVKHWPDNLEAVIALAHQEAAKDGLGSMDALHIAAGILIQADELVTIEKLTKSIHRTKSIKVVGLY